MSSLPPANGGPSDGKLRIVVSPVMFNERGKAERVIERLKEMLHEHPDYAVRIIDDGSTDGSLDAIKASGLPYVAHPQRMGVGVAVRSAVDAACADGSDVVVIMAGNDKDRPSEVPRLLQKLREGYDFVIGSRFLPGGRFDNTPKYRILATRFVHPGVVWLTTGRRLTDTSTGFRAIRTDVFRNPKINLRQEWLKDYDCEMYIMYQAIALGYRIAEVPASKIYPPHELGYTKMPAFSGWAKMLRPFFLLRMGLKR